MNQPPTLTQHELVAISKWGGGSLGRGSWSGGHVLRLVLDLHVLRLHRPQLHLLASDATAQHRPSRRCIVCSPLSQVVVMLFLRFSVAGWTHSYTLRCAVLRWHGFVIKPKHKGPARVFSPRAGAITCIGTTICGSLTATRTANNTFVAPAGPHDKLTKEQTYGCADTMFAYSPKHRAYPATAARQCQTVVRLDNGQRSTGPRVASRPQWAWQPTEHRLLLGPGAARP